MQLPQTAWVTLVTQANYLPGAVLLAHSLNTSSSKYPLIILTTKSFPPAFVPALEEECAVTNAIHMSIESLVPLAHNRPATLIAERFADTWTKLRVFELYKYGCRRLVFLDADMLVLKNMDELFDLELPKNWIAANHACVCNLDNDTWAPESWTRENCAYTGLRHNSEPAEVITGTRSLLNSGLFIFSPHEKQWDQILDFLDEEDLKGYLFPDQDFLAAFFQGRWRSVGWQYNALKTMRYWHQNMWSDEAVRNLHFIVDKPWSCRVKDGIAGYLGRDAVTHGWWWTEYDRWQAARQGTEILDVMRRLCA